MRINVITLIFFSVLVIYFWTLVVGKSNINPSLNISSDDCSASPAVQELCYIGTKILEFREANGYYPISGPKLDTWLVIITSDNVFDSNFIPGIKLYLTDPRNRFGPNIQYRYISDGAKFKLLIDAPEVCEQIKVLHSNLLNRPDDCRSFGVWSGMNASSL